MVDNTLRIQIDSGERETNAEAYLHALQATIDVLKEVNKESSRFGSESIEWQITDAGKNSPLFTSIAGVSPMPLSLSETALAAGSHILRFPEKTRS